MEFRSEHQRGNRPESTAMGASIGKFVSPAQGVAQFKRDGYYAKDHPVHREASDWTGKSDGSLGPAGPVDPVRSQYLHRHPRRHRRLVARSFSAAAPNKLDNEGVIEPGKGDLGGAAPLPAHWPPAMTEPRLKTNSPPLGKWLARLLGQLVRLGVIADQRERP